MKDNLSMCDNLKTQCNQMHKSDEGEIIQNTASVLPYLVVCDQIGRFRLSLVAEFFIWSLVVFWDFQDFAFGLFGKI